MKKNLFILLILAVNTLYGQNKREKDWNNFRVKFIKAYDTRNTAQLKAMTTSDFFSADCFDAEFDSPITAWMEYIFSAKAKPKYLELRRRLKLKAVYLPRRNNKDDYTKAIGGDEYCNPIFVYEKGKVWKFAGFIWST